MRKVVRWVNFIGAIIISPVLFLVLFGYMDDPMHGTWLENWWWQVVLAFYLIDAICWLGHRAIATR